MAEATTYENLSSQFLSASSPEELGLWFLSVRTSAGMTQKEVAKRMDKQEADYAKLERGEGNPTFKTIQKFCSATSTPIFN